MATIRLAVIQYDCGTPSAPDTAVFAVGWDVDPDGSRLQDDVRIQSVKDVCGIKDRFIQSVRFVEVPVELTPTEIGTVEPTSEEKA